MIPFMFPPSLCPLDILVRLDIATNNIDTNEINNQNTTTPSHIVSSVTNGIGIITVSSVAEVSSPDDSITNEVARNESGIDGISQIHDDFFVVEDSASSLPAEDEAYLLRLETLRLRFPVTTILDDDNPPIIVMFENNYVATIQEVFTDAFMQKWIGVDHSVFRRVRCNVRNLPAYDIGGVFRTLSSCYAQNIQLMKSKSHIHLFAGPDGENYPNNMTCLKAPECLYIYESIGRFMFLAILHDLAFPNNFHSYVLKYITEEENDFTFDDFNTASMIQLHEWIRILSDFTIDVPDIFAEHNGDTEEEKGPLESFAWKYLKIEDTSFCSKYNDEYKSLHVLEKKLTFWRNFLVKEYFIGKVKAQLDAMRNGFNFARETAYSLGVKYRFLCLYHLKLCLTFDDLIQSIDWGKHDKDDKLVKGVRETLQKLDDDENRKEVSFTAMELYSFITGFNKIPPPQKIHIHVSNGEDEAGRCPDSHTCTYTFDVSRRHYMILDENESYVFNDDIFIEDL